MQVAVSEAEGDPLKMEAPPHIATQRDVASHSLHAVIHHSKNNRNSAD